ncbi:MULTISPECIES: dipeptidase [unclassified Sphingomonas]|nr:MULTISPECIES: membrane dipeptidase [unclassified Sphingomonas]KQX26342.1 dipeptidase [Sphingomonas sp. Root1294]KQY69412.1 dipeptidase [Sphingomonas sp. Root50]KRB89824.1 dipeptidase [Sphingomonas sp. Root720]
MTQLSRRTLLQGAAASAAALGFPMINRGYFALHAASPHRYSRRAVDLMERALVIDMLAVLKIDGRPQAYQGRMDAKTAAEFRDSGITGFHQSMGFMGPTAREDVLTWIGESAGFAARNDDVFLLVDRADDLRRAKKERRCAVILGVQNSEHFRNTDDVKTFYQLGQRCSQLTYNAQNLLGSGSTERVDGGVTDFGVSIIGAMNGVGMLVDVSHCGDRTTLDGIALSSVPIAITHANCRALVDHPRCKSDEAIKALAAKGGVMGITGVRNFVSAKEPTAVPQIVDHIDHVARLVGVEHVGIGSDADLNGYDDMPKEDYEKLKAGYKASYAFRGKIDTDGFDHPRKMFDLTEEQIRRSYSDEHIVAILGGNFFRLLSQTWK